MRRIGWAEDLRRIEQEIKASAGRAGRDPASVRLVAATKAVPAEVVAQAVRRPPARVSARGSCQYLSMGMPDDFRIAVGQGATIVRTGRAIFDDRTAQLTHAPLEV